MLVQRTFAFIDLCGFTAFTSDNGEDEAVRVLARFRATVRDVASERGVRVAKWLGDGAMFVSTEAPPLVAAALETEQHIDEAHGPLALRAGLSCGEVILFEGDDYVGSCVNLAARLCDVAQPHETLALSDLASAAPEWATAEPIEPLQIAGFSVPVPIVRLRSLEHAA